MIGSLLSSSRYGRVLRLLDQERRVILDGPLAALQPLVDRREALLDELLAGDPELPEAFLVALKARAERNSRLLLASIAGVKSAESQIARINDARDQLRTYSAAGAPVEVRRVQVTRDTRT